MGAQSTVNGTYARVGPGDRKFLGVHRPVEGGGDNPTATTRLIPIPMAWGAYFLDSPSFGVAVRRMYRLVDALPCLKRIQFAPILDSLILACYGNRPDDKDSYSFLSSEWDALPLHQRTKAWMQERWAAITADNDDDVSDGGETVNSEDDRKLPARPVSRPASPQNPPLSSRVSLAPSALGSSPKRVRRVPAPTAAAP